MRPKISLPSNILTGLEMLNFSSAKFECENCLTFFYQYILGMLSQIFGVTINFRDIRASAKPFGFTTQHPS